MKKITVGSCFSGIGGLELGLEWTGGFETKWQIEIDPYATRVLEKHWSHAKRETDIRTVNKLESVDLICGGFPCQDVSRAGKRAGITGDRSSLYRELLRTVRMVRPKFTLMENVGALLDDGMGVVLGDMAETGEDVEWDCISACEFGAPHTRERVFILAYPSGKPVSFRIFDWDGANARGGWYSKEVRSEDWAIMETRTEAHRRIRENSQWVSEPKIPRMAHGIPEVLDQVRCLGNAVVPQVAQKIGEMILNYET